MNYSYSLIISWIYSFTLKIIGFVLGEILCRTKNHLLGHIVNMPRNSFIYLFKTLGEREGLNKYSVQVYEYNALSLIQHWWHQMCYNRVNGVHRVSIKHWIWFIGQLKNTGLIVVAYVMVMKQTTNILIKLYLVAYRIDVWMQPCCSNKIQNVSSSSLYWHLQCKIFCKRALVKVMNS